MSDWRDRAACKGDLFFGRDRIAAVATCLSCDVRAECHQWATEDRNFEGIAAGLNWKQSQKAGTSRNHHSARFDWEDFDYLLGQGLTLAQIAERLGIKRASLQKAITRRNKGLAA